MVCLEGYVLCFAPIVMKMMRITYIFHNPFNSAKKVSKTFALLILSLKWSEMHSFISANISSNTVGGICKINKLFLLGRLNSYTGD